LIMTSVLVTGEKLPSVRELSKMITVNPNTVMKAYQELEREGYIYTTSGVGTFVADKSELCVDSKRLEEVKNSLLNAFKQLQYLGLSFDDAKDVALKIINERGNKND
ncbi:MAG: GntR family transcriptional regulator, partial [Anaerovoracaceae bacterium]